MLTRLGAAEITNVHADGSVWATVAVPPATQRGRASDFDPALVWSMSDAWIAGLLGLRSWSLSNLE